MALRPLQDATPEGVGSRSVAIDYHCLSMITLVELKPGQCCTLYPQMMVESYDHNGVVQSAKGCGEIQQRTHALQHFRYQWLSMYSPGPSKEQFQWNVFHGMLIAFHHTGCSPSCASSVVQQQLFPGHWIQS